VYPQASEAHRRTAASTSRPDNSRRAHTNRVAWVTEGPSEGGYVVIGTSLEEDSKAFSDTIAKRSILGDGLDDFHSGIQNAVNATAVETCDRYRGGGR